MKTAETGMRSNQRAGPKVHPFKKQLGATPKSLLVARNRHP